MEPDWVLHPEVWAGSHSILICALSCRRDEPDDLSSLGDPHALIAPFARRSHYAAAAGMMRALLRRIGPKAGFSAREARIFVNSCIPEKPLLAASGLGSYGKNGLLLIPGLGSLFVIAGCVLPFRAAEPAAPTAGDSPGFSPCGSCGRCITACPVGAIVEPGVVDPDRCLQGLAEKPVLVDSRVMRLWGCRLYGCQDCQGVCPRNAGLAEDAPACPTEAGPSVSIRRILSHGTDGVRGMFRGTPMGMSRIPPVALLRNALIAAGNRGDPVLRNEIERYQGHEEPVLRETARWAFERLAGR